jgi:malonyl-ACP decarboxylase
MFHRVVVTGLGAVTSIGSDYKAFTNSLRAGTCGISLEADDGLGLAGRLASSIDFVERLGELDLPSSLSYRAQRAGRRAPISVQAGILCVLEAWREAFRDNKKIPLDSINLIVAGSNISQGYQYQIQKAYHENPEYVPASYALHFLDTNHVGVLSEVLKLSGEGFTVGAASASGNMGILQAWRNIRHGIKSCCVVVGTMADLSPVELQAFHNCGALGGISFANEPDQACRPFDQDREGFIYGQGSACLVLESLESAEARGAVILGEIAGGACCLDSNRLSDPSVDGEVRVMRMALEAADCPLESVTYMNAHATSSVLGDQVEVDAIKKVFGGRIKDLMINSTKGLTGHCLQAAGVVEAAATLIQLRNGFLHPSLNLRQPIDNECQFVGPTACEREVDVAMCNGFGFGGINTSLVIKRVS